MRDRLIELIGAKICEDYSPICDEWQPHSCEKCYVSNCRIGDLADYLLENGVVALPCKVGDDVYVIEPCTCFNNYRSFEECHRRRTAATKWIDIVNVQKKHHKKCLKLFIRPFKIEYLNKVGKTVFLSLEDAERALRKEGEGK